MPKPEFWTGSGRIRTSTSRWNAVGAVIYLMRGRLATIDQRMPVQNGRGMAKYLTGLDGFSRWRLSRIGCKHCCTGAGAESG